jgi:hypothetical protein
MAQPGGGSRARAAEHRSAMIAHRYWTVAYEPGDAYHDLVNGRSSSGKANWLMAEAAMTRCGAEVWAERRSGAVWAVGGREP